MKSVTLVDYGAGNLLNVVRALEYCGITPQVTQNPLDVARAERIIFPGVGAFGDCMKALGELELVKPLQDYIHAGKPFLGICVGMQVLFEEGEEFGTHKGLGVVPGRVVRIPDTGPDGKKHKIPHIGWSRLLRPDGCEWKGSIMEPLGTGADVYFVHSYMGTPLAQDELAYVNYNGVHVAAAVRRGNLYGVQFHPEKSGEAGLSILRAFLQNA
ncbi:MAG: imidazole glycerol phosphate synthase subunit HisH [Proteobacteria bacterium]|nr:imidazole glycerol phosphate synthase subunit HisH [Pseudomonadota bacterium]